MTSQTRTSGVAGSKRARAQEATRTEVLEAYRRLKDELSGEPSLLEVAVESGYSMSTAWRYLVEAFGSARTRGNSRPSRRPRRPPAKPPTIAEVRRSIAEADAVKRAEEAERIEREAAKRRARAARESPTVTERAKRDYKRAWAGIRA